MPIAYVAHAVHAALLLDEDGVCRWVVPQPSAAPESLRAARRAVDAQFVASLDPSVEGCLHHQPRVGAAMLFTAMKDGRAALVRFGPLTQFDEVPTPATVTTDAEAVALVTLSFRAPPMPLEQVPLKETQPPTPKTVTETPPPMSAAVPSDASITGVFTREENDAELLRVVAGLAAELAPVSTAMNDDDDGVRPSGVSSREGGSDETSQFSYAVMGNPSQRADSAWPQALNPPRMPRRIG